MSQSLSKVYLHLIFSTKGRMTFIQPEWESQLHAYMGEIIKKVNRITLQEQHIGKESESEEIRRAGQESKS
jgi:hypothetical protein